MASNTLSHPARCLAAGAAAAVVIGWAGWSQVDTIVRDTQRLQPADVAARMWLETERRYEPLHAKFAPGEVVGYLPRQQEGDIQHTLQWTYAQYFAAPVVLDVAREHVISVADFTSPEQARALMALGTWKLREVLPGGLAIVQRKPAASQESP